MERNAHYNFVFILRLWRNGDADAAGWRFTVEDTMTGERRGFGDLKRAVRFIECEMEASAAAADESS